MLSDIQIYRIKTVMVSEQLLKALQNLRRAQCAFCDLLPLPYPARIITDNKAEEYRICRANHNKGTGHSDALPWPESQRI
jgi:hypothetical protein